MATEVKLPELGDGIESGDVLEIFVAVGDDISEGQDIVEMETDKATVPVPASVGGKVTKILVSEGDTVPIGGAILEVEAVAGATTPAAPTPEAAQPTPEAAQPAPEAAQPEPVSAEPADTAPASPQPATSESVATPTPQAPPPQRVVPAASSGAAGATTAASASSKVIAAGPAIRRFAREVGVDLSRVVGSGANGRITREDVLTVVRSANQSARTTAVASSSSPAAPAGSPPSPALPGAADVDDFGPVRVEAMSRIRKTIAKKMHVSWSNVPRVTNFDDADITDLEFLRQSSKEDYAAQGLKLTTMPFLIKAVATALRHHSTINAVIDQENDQVIYKDYVNVGIAVDTERGLVVPVMQKADTMGIPEIARALAEMAGKVRGGTFGLSDLRGGTFTISNLGAIGGQYSTPIINVPEVAILLVGRSRKLPVVMPDDSIEPRLMMPLSLSYDHRLVDGATAARFLNDVIGYLEAPSRLLLAL
jgi:pyruvate dehydrogenase E2 component (dihydrolipoamide acetyltransferase)